MTVPNGHSSNSLQTVMLTHLGDNIIRRMKSHGFSLTSVGSAYEQLGLSHHGAQLLFQHLYHRLLINLTIQVHSNLLGENVRALWSL